jgi:FixJ family two-component response regulator
MDSLPAGSRRSTLTDGVTQPWRVVGASHPSACADDFLRSPRLNDTSCVITDVQMSGMSGVELQSVLIASGKNIPIIFITAYPDEKIRARAMAAGAVGFLSKPFKGSTLIQYIDDALKSQSERF